MKNLRRYALILFLIITLINTVIFLNRDKFVYHKNASYTSLYSSDTVKWKQFVYDYSPDEFEKVKQILNDSVKIETKTSSQKVLTIGRMLVNRFNKQMGKPSNILLSSSPLQQYKMLCSSDTEQIWCGVYADMFAFFCWGAGIPCRVIEIMNPGDRHVLNECYLREVGEWVVVDLTYNRLLIRNQQKKRYANFFDILYSTKDSLIALQTTKDSVISTQLNASSYSHYLRSHPPIYYYYRTNNFEVYKPFEKVKRYLLPSAWYEEVNVVTNSNWLFYLKELFLFLWLINFLTLLLQIFKK